MIGHNLLEGKLANLAKPLAVLHKSSTEAFKNVDALAKLMDNEPTASTAAATNPSWNMIAIVKKKIVFSKRPTPIVGVKPDSQVKQSV